MCQLATLCRHQQTHLAAIAPLFRANLCPLTFVDVLPDVYAQAMLGI